MLRETSWPFDSGFITVFGGSARIEDRELEDCDLGTLECKAILLGLDFALKVFSKYGCKSREVKTPGNSENQMVNSPLSVFFCDMSNMLLKTKLVFN